MPRIAHLRSERADVVVALDEGTPRILWWGAPLGEADGAVLDALLDRPVVAGGLDAVAPLLVLPAEVDGFDGPPGLAGRRGDGGAWAPTLVAVESSVDGDTIRHLGRDRTAALAVETVLGLDRHGVLRLSCTLTNEGLDAYELSALRPTLPLPGHATEVEVFGGRWANEFRPERRAWRSGTQLVEHHRGRTSHDRLPLAFAGSAGFSEERGDVHAVHLAWSGNASLRFDTTGDGARFVQVAEALLPGEVVLAPGESHRCPDVVAACSTTGRNGISDAFHDHVRARPSHPSRPRPVLLNTWEAVYFDHDLARLRALADAAAEVGIERFVLDDGWFHGRRSDDAGLGDWWVDAGVWPDGLAPLVDHVRGRGMEFGIWVEPEMVNPDSDLFRAHPDWVLGDPSHPPLLGRNQLVLDLARPEVAAHLFDHLDRLLTDHEIAYVKWDMNRDLVAPTHDGRASARRQTSALYALIDRLRTAHPTVEFESCASGGGRIDFGVLDRVDRFWTSDCNDALDRQRIQRGFSTFLPPELMGAHIGPGTAHTTSRSHHLPFRAATALFGHLGVEWNLLDATESQRRRLADAIALHKRLRPLLHSGRVRRIDHPDPAVTAHAVIAHDGSEAVVSVAQIATSDALAVAPVRVGGLDPDAEYTVALLDVPGQRFGMARSQPAWIAGGVRVRGQVLATVGVRPPVLQPESAVLLHLERTP